MPPPAQILLDRAADGLAQLTIENPPGNRLDGGCLTLLAEAAAELRRDPPSALVVAGAGRAFCTGIDPSVFVEEGSTSTLVSVAEVTAVARRFHLLCDALVEAPYPTVAAMRGPALGGGLELALVCDHRVASPTSTLGMPEIRLGLLPGGGGTQRLPRMLGRAAAFDLLLTGGRLNGVDAHALGLVDELVDRAEVHDAAVAAARRLAELDPAIWRGARALLSPPATGAQNWK